MIKLFVTDLDDTLLNQAKKVEERDKMALSKLVQHGIAVCFASGRMDDELIRVMKEVEGTYHRVSHNGAYVFTDQGEALGETTFEGDIAKRIYEAAREHGLYGFISTDNMKLIPEYNDYLREMDNRLHIGFQENPNILSQIGHELLPSKVCIFGEKEKLIQFQQVMKKEYDEHHDSFISAPDCIDFMPKNVSKGSGLIKLLEKLEIRSEEMACVGDSYNDISMFQLTPYSFAMAIADDEVKQHAKQGVVESVSEAAERVLKVNQQLSSQI
ncbi:HAD family hydrolase [Risungbinella massiliensis]|uniref:HAD family hydrolase n=1 Tax=Risungbinella massiliensis TaxID=1329796 RepID=UPI0005CC8D6C|nr:HAD family hydrolase [Risungbinella massiliensis]